MAAPEGPGALRRRVSEAISDKDTGAALYKIRSIAPKKAINPLVSLLYSGDARFKKRVVSVFGDVMASLAVEDMEAARIVMRRLMWSLNDESGGIGWGAPEAMAEAMTRSEPLAREYAHILVSYICEDGNYLEYAPLRKGALSGIARLAEERPILLERLKTKGCLEPFLASEDPEERDAARKALASLNKDSD